ncbi:MAG: 5-(carboxyamino)imidazole ribonucleotide synthase [Cyclonatronaceae bacterium]
MITTLPLSSRTTIGFLGAGQLARMSAAVVMRLGMRAAVYSGSGTHRSLEPETLAGSRWPLQPLEWMTPLQFPGRFDDEDALVRFARLCDVVTLENEFLDGALLSRVQERSETSILPSPASFIQLESKWLEKETFRKAGIPVTPYRKISALEDMADFAQSHGYPFVLKSSKGGYDGYGNKTVRSPEEHQLAFTSLGGDSGHELIAEAFIPFQKELAVQIARNRIGTAVYPCCETIQQDHICKTVIAPAQIDNGIAREACRLSEQAMEAIDGIGLFAFEFFLTDDGRLFLNESAPRPHNSGHYTIEGCITSQFENHIRAVMGLPLGPTDLRAPVAVMENILGKREGEAIAEAPESLWSTKNAWLHIYGKSDSRNGRKMGHLTVLGDDPVETGLKASGISNQIQL